jgi:hypothetical protein
LCIPLECQFFPPTPVFWKPAGPTNPLTLPYPRRSAPKTEWAWKRAKTRPSYLCNRGMLPPNRGTCQGVVQKALVDFNTLLLSWLTSPGYRTPCGARVGTIQEKPTINQVLRRRNIYWLQLLLVY